MAADNTLGAPTEGLGQTVTFAGGQGRAEPQVPVVQRQALRAGATGGGATRSAEALRTPDPVGNGIFQTLTKLAGDVLKPQLEAERRLSFAKGMQQAAQRRAINEIVDEQPWYSKMFGSTSLVDGARAYSAAAKATDVATAIEDNMGELRKLSANEVSKYVADKMLSAAKTGDATTDAMVLSQVSQTIPNVLKSQAKAHLVYRQEMFGKSIHDNSLASGAMLRALDANARKDGATVDPLDLQIAEINYTESLRRPSEMSKDAHDALIVSASEGMIANGNFKVYDVLEKSGKLEDLSPQHRYTLRRAKLQASTQAKIDLPIEFIRKAFEWKASSGKGASEQDMIDGRAAHNAEYTKLTGDPSPYISNDLLVMELLQRDAAEERANKPKALTAAETANAKAQKQLAEDMLAVGALLTPGGANLTDKPAKEQQRILDLARTGMPKDKYATVAVLQAEVNVYDARLKDTIQGKGRAAVRMKSPIDFQDVFQQEYMPLVAASGGAGDVIAQAYVGTELGDMFKAWHDVTGGKVVDGNQAVVAFDLATERKPSKLSGKDDEAMVASLSKGRWARSGYAIGRAFGSDDYVIENPRNAIALLKPYMPINETDPDKAVSVAMRRAVAKDVSAVGGYMWYRGAQETRLDTYLTDARARLGDVTKSDYNQVVRGVIDDVVSELRITEELTVGQLADGPNKTPQIYVFGFDGNGNRMFAKLSGEDIVTRHTGRAAAKEQAKKEALARKDYVYRPPAYRGEK